MTLASRTAAVTGASGAIGSAISKALSELGAHVVAIDIAGSDSPVADAGITQVRLDLSDAVAIAAASSEIVNRFGSIEIRGPNGGHSLFGLKERPYRSHLRDRTRDGRRRDYGECDCACLRYVSHGVGAADGGATRSSVGANPRRPVLQT